MERHPLKIETSDLSDLVRAAQGGDESAFPALIAATEVRLYRFLLFLSTDAELANDLAQDTYLYVLENLSKLKDPEAFVHWLLKIGRHKFLDHKKSPRNRPHAGVETLDGLDSGAAPEQRELVLQVRRTLAALEPEARVVLVLVDIEGYSMKEASEIIEITESALTSRLRRAREAFHKKYFGG